MDVVDSCLKCEKCESKAMMWTSVWAQKVTVWWQYISVWWQNTPVQLQSAQRKIMRDWVHMYLKTKMT